jgi:hypothetical protein
VGESSKDYFGRSLAVAGDLDGDQLPDVVVASVHSTRAFSGATGATLFTAPSSHVVSGLGDLNADGVDDVVDFVMSHDFSQKTLQVLSGADGTPLFQQSVSSLFQVIRPAGDVNQDGVPDFLVGPGLTSDFSGAALLYSGRSYPASVTTYGTGWPGTLGVPSINASTVPVLCNPLTLIVVNSLGAPTTGILIVGLARASIPTAFDGVLLVLPSWIFTIPLPSSFASFSVTVPCDTLLAGITIDLQALEVDPGASRGVSFTPGLEMVLGG